MNKLNISSLELPLNSATRTFAILAKGGAFGNAINLLKRNGLIKEEGGMVFVNPDL